MKAGPRTQGSDGRGYPIRARRVARGALATALATGLAALAVAATASAGSPPTAVTEPATGVARTGAVLLGTVDPHGTQVAECVFRYGKTPALGSSVPCSYSPGAGVTPVPVEATLSGLSESTTYYYEVFAKDANGESAGEERRLTTLPTAPVSESRPPVEVGHTTATFQGIVTPNESEVTECFFEYGTSPGALPSTAACSSLPGSGTEPVAVSAHVEGLAESRTYYYRLDSRNAFGLTQGALEPAFTAPNQPAASTEPADPVGHTTATLNGVVDPRDALVEQCFFQWGPTTALENTAPCTVPPGAGEDLVPVSAPLEGLTESTTYYYRTVATNVFGENAGAQRQFTTEPTLAHAQIGKATEVSARSAILTGTVDPEGTQLTECRFEYGTTPAFPGVGTLGHTAPCSTSPGGTCCTQFPSGSEKQEVTAGVALSPTTTYVFRLVVGNSYGIDYSGEEHVTTFAAETLPVVTKLKPKKGPPAGGNTVTVKGKNLAGAVAVDFGGVESPSIISTTTESVTAVVPPGAGSVDVTVTTPDGTSEWSQSASYSYGAPVVTEVSPGTGTLAGGTNVTVTGEGFRVGTEQMAFVFGKASAIPVVCESLNTCTMKAPPAWSFKAGTVKVRAVVGGRYSKVTPGSLYRYTAP